MNHKTLACRTYISLILIVALALQVMIFPFTGEPVFAATRISLDKAIQLAIHNSDALEEIKLDLLKKIIWKRQQAVEGLRDIRKKESTVRFSLLFSISFPEKHAMPKEIELIMKIPKIDHEIDILNHKLAFNQQKI